MAEKPNKRILFVTNLELWSMSMGDHGATMGNQSMYNCLLGWLRHGYEVHVLTAAQQIREGVSLPEGLHIHRHPLPLRWGKRAARAVLRVLRRRKTGQGEGAEDTSGPRTAMDWRRYKNTPYVLMFNFWIGLWALLLQTRYRFRFFYGYECHGAPVAWFWSRIFRRPLVTRFQGTLMTKWIDQPQVLRQLHSLVRPLALKSDLLIMTNDGTQGNRMLEHLGVPEERYVFWRNGIAFEKDLDPNFDPAAFRLAEGIAPETVLLTSASRMVVWKRIDRMLKACAELGESLDFLLVLIGDGVERPGLEHLAESLGLGQRVRFTGALPHRSVIQWHQAADILISTFDVSNVGNQLLEAQPLGKPYVSVDTGDTADILIDGRNGLLVADMDDAGSLAEAMSRLIRDPALREQFGRGALEVADEQVCSWEERMEREVALVEERLGFLND